MTRSRILAVLVAAGALLAAGTSAAGAAQPKVHAPTAGSHVRISGLGGVRPNAPLQTDIGAGYFIYPGTPNVSSVSATFTVPSISCSGPHINEGVFPGIWIYDGSGTLTQQVDVNLFCESGQVFYADVVCIAGSAAVCVQRILTISPGDRIVASFSESAWHTQGQLKDLTTGAISYIYDGAPAPTSDYTVFVGDAGPAPFGFSTHVPIFANIPFSKGRVDGYTLSEYAAAAAVLKSGSLVQIKTNHLHGDGDAFNTTFAHI